jgi:hypothetical protein
MLPRARRSVTRELHPTDHENDDGRAAPSRTERLLALLGVTDTTGSLLKSDF